MGVGGNEITFSPPFIDTKYPVIGRPPFDAGTVQFKVDFTSSLDVAVNPMGALGTVDGTALAIAEYGPMSVEFCAATLKCCSIPFGYPKTVVGLEVTIATPDQLTWSVLDCIMYWIIGLPPGFAGAVQLNGTCSF